MHRVYVLVLYVCCMCGGGLFAWGMDICGTCTHVCSVHRYVLVLCVCVAWVMCVGCMHDTCMYVAGMACVYVFCVFCMCGVYVGYVYEVWVYVTHVRA